MDKICLVFDIDETILHYKPANYLPNKFEYEDDIIENNKIIINFR